MTLLITKIKLNKLEWFSTVDKGASGDDKHRARIVLWKRDAPSWRDRLKDFFRASITPIEKQTTEEAPKMTLEEILAKLPEEERNVILAALQAAKAPAAQPAPMQAAEGNPEEPKPEEMAKALKDLPEAVRVVVEKAMKEGQAAGEEKAELEKRLADLEDRARLVEFTKRAETLEFLPMTTVDLAKMLKDVDDALDADRSKAFGEMLVKIEKAMAESEIFIAVGSDQTGGTETALEKRDKLVAELRKENPRLKVQQARTRVYRAHPELYAEIQKEKAH
jgi:hypothetical protein